MKFSYTLLKKYLPRISSKDDLIKTLEAHAFEAEDAGEGTIDVSIPTNRYSDVASHIGIIKEMAAILNLKTKNVPELKPVSELKLPSDKAKVKIKEKKLCSRYIAGRFKNVQVKESPEWVRQVLKEAGMRPINNIVDTMNYIMLETGQPLHAFDADKISGKIVIRKAKKREAFISIDNEKYSLDESNLVIADDDKVLAVAGIKGGKSSEVDKNTKNIIIESANFDSLSVYRSSRDLGLVTDASLRFSHKISSTLAGIGFARVVNFLTEEAEAEMVSFFDSSPQQPKKKTILLDIDWLNGFLGTHLQYEEVAQKLDALGFEVKDNQVSVPEIRRDINTREDLAEEIIRSFGLNNLEPMPLKISLSPPVTDKIFTVKEAIRDHMESVGYDEVYTHSFVRDVANSEAVELDNPISEEKGFLRHNLLGQILNNLKENKKFFHEVRIFEIGRVFEWDYDSINETTTLGVGVHTDNKESFFELKGVITSLIESLGILDVDLVYEEEKNGFYIKDSQIGTLGRVIAYAKNISVAEINVDALMSLCGDRRKFKPIPKYPAVERDVSLAINEAVRIGDIISSIKDIELVKKIEIIDEYFIEEEDKESITLRVTVRSDVKTLTAEEVSEVIDKVHDVLKSEPNIEIR